VGREVEPFPDRLAHLREPRHAHQKVERDLMGMDERGGTGVQEPGVDGLGSGLKLDHPSTSVLLEAIQARRASGEYRFRRPMRTLGILNSAVCCQSILSEMERSLAARLASSKRGRD
jgi:hypothetical protein